MDIRSSLDGLKTLLGVTAPVPASTQATHATAAIGGSGLGSDRATLSSAGSEVSLTATDSGVRTDKVAAVQSALAAGTYSVPAMAVASKMVDAMLGDDR
jgi:negative regulator of flagellin synthesis FlgM